MRPLPNPYPTTSPKLSAESTALVHTSLIRVRSVEPPRCPWTELNTTELCKPSNHRQHPPRHHAHRALESEIPSGTAHQLSSYVRSLGGARETPDMIDPDRTFGDACRSPTSSADEPEGVGSCQHLCSSLVGQDLSGPRSRTASLNPATTSP
jgi:hypothetical protein